MTRFLRPETAFFLLVWVLLLILFRERGFWDPGSLWHTKVGELILDHGLVRTDPFTFTFEGKAWMPQQWGAEVLMALAHRAGGLDAMLLGFGTLVAALFTWVFARMRAAGMAPALAAAFTGAALFCGAFHYYVRPHMVTIAFLGWTMACIVDFDRGRATLWRLAGLIPLYVLWTNLHGGVPGGVMMLGLAVAWWGVLFLLKKDSPIRSWRTAWALVGVLAACGLTPFDNPYGLEMIRIWQRILQSDVLKQVVNEHKPLNITQSADQCIVGFAALYLFLLAGTLPGKPRVSWLIPLVWLALTVKGIRQGPLFVVTGAVAIADLWPHTVWCRLLKRHGDSLVQDPPAAAATAPAFALPLAAVLASLALVVAGIAVPVVGRGWVRLDPGYAPVELTDTLRDYAHTAGPGARIYNDCNLGGYLIYNVPDLKIFMDDRFELYRDEWTADYVDTIWYHPEKFDRWTEQYGFDRALVVTNPEDRTPLDLYLSRPGSGWVEVGRAKCAVLFRRQPASGGR